MLGAEAETWADNWCGVSEESTAVSVRLSDPLKVLLENNSQMTNVH